MVATKTLLLLAKAAKQHQIERRLARRLREAIAPVFVGPIEGQGDREIARYYLVRSYEPIRRNAIEVALEASQYGANRAVSAAQRAGGGKPFKPLPEAVRGEIRAEVARYADNYYRYLEEQVEKDSDRARVAYLRKTPDLLAREVIVYATSRGEYEANLRIGGKHVWISRGDEDVRSSHERIHGETVKVGERFSNGCRYPHDPEGPAEETYGCRCRLKTAA